MAHSAAKCLAPWTSLHLLSVRTNLLVPTNHRLTPLLTAPLVFVFTGQGYQPYDGVDSLCVARWGRVTWYAAHRAAVAPGPAGQAGRVPVGAAVHRGGVDDGGTDWTFQ